MVENFTELNGKVNPVNVEKKVASTQNNLIKNEDDSLLVLLESQARGQNIVREEIAINSIERKTKHNCKYWNQGYCCRRNNCSFHHEDEDCQEYFKQGNCNKKLP